MWLHWLGIVPQTEWLWVRFQGGVRAWVAGLVPSWGTCRRQPIDASLPHQCFFSTFLPLSLPLSLESVKKKEKFLKKSAVFSTAAGAEQQGTAEKQGRGLTQGSFRSLLLCHSLNEVPPGQASTKLQVLWLHSLSLLKPYCAHLLHIFSHTTNHLLRYRNQLPTYCDYCILMVIPCWNAGSKRQHLSTFAHGCTRRA